MIELLCDMNQSFANETQVDKFRLNNLMGYTKPSSNSLPLIFNPLQPTSLMFSPLILLLSPLPPMCSLSHPFPVHIQIFSPNPTHHLLFQPISSPCGLRACVLYVPVCLCVFVFYFPMCLWNSFLCTLMSI